MATPTRKSAMARLRTKHQLWLLFFRSIFSMAAITSRLVEMMRVEAMLRIRPISLGLTTPELCPSSSSQAGAAGTERSAPPGPLKADMLGGRILDLSLETLVYLHAGATLTHKIGPRIQRRPADVLTAVHKITLTRAGKPTALSAGFSSLFLPPSLSHPHRHTHTPLPLLAVLSVRVQMKPAEV